MKTKNLFIILVVATLFASTMLVSAEEVIVASDSASPISHFLNNVFHYSESYSVVGDARSCGLPGGNANYEWEVAAGKMLDGSQGVVSGSVQQCTNGMYDVFTSGWTAFAEFNKLYATSGTSTKSVGGYSCGTGPCHVQAYCCPSAEPTSQSGCSGLTTFKTAQCTNTIVKSGTTFYWCPSPTGTIESGIPYAWPSYNYCQATTTMTCYYKSGGTCSESYKRTYDKSVFPNPCESYTYEDGHLYSSLSACNGAAGCSVNRECPSGKVCSGGSCVSGCTPNWGCGAWSDLAGDCGTRTCTDANSCGTTSGKPETSKTCGGGGCTSNQACMVGSCQGTQTCSGGTLGECVKDDPACGGSGDGTSSLVSGVTVTDIQVPSGKSSWDLVDIEENFKVTFQNTENVEKHLKVEYGFYTQSYAKTVAKLFSVFPIFATVSPQPVASCVSTEPFVKTYDITLQPNEKKTVTLKLAPYNAYITLAKGNTYVLEDTKLVSFLGVLAHYGEGECCQKLPDFSGCSEGTGGYLASKYAADYYHRNTAVSSWFQSQDITCEGQIYGTVHYYTFNPDTITISRDYHDCIDYGNFYTINGSVNQTATDDYKAQVQSGQLSKVKKVTLTRDEISKATNTQLLASACLQPDECVLRNNYANSSEGYTASCTSIRSLRDDGVLTDAKKNSFFEEAKAKINGGISGGAIGGTIGLLGCGALIIATPFSGGIAALPAATLCSTLIIGGAAVGGGLGYTFSGVDQNDPLIKELNAANDNAVGVCTAEPPPFDVGNILNKIGKSVKITGNPTWDGIIIIVGGLLVLMFLLNTLTKK